MKKNRIEFEGNLMYLYPTNKPDIKFTLDKEDYDKIKNFSWVFEKNKYIVERINNLLLHRFLMNIHNDKYKYIKYKDNNIFNLTKNNLLITDKYQKGNIFCFDDSDNTIVYLILNNNKYILDIEDYDKISKFTWHIKYKSNLLETRNLNTTLSNFLLKCKSERNKYYIKFKNNNYFDYRKDNLQIDYFKNSTIIEKDNFIILIPSNSDNNYIFDKEYKDILKCYNWQDNKGYLSTTNNNCHIRAYWFVIGQPINNLVVDHIDQNTLNNRKSNLRVVTEGFNDQNKTRKNKSGFTGVHWKNNRNKYEAYINYNKKSIYIGSFNNVIDAAQAYDKKAIELYGENAGTNLKSGNYEKYYNNMNINY